MTPTNILSIAKSESWDADRILKELEAYVIIPKFGLWERFAGIIHGQEIQQWETSIKLGKALASEMENL